jgi:hypothetical protein
MPGPRCAIEYDIKFTHILLKWEGLLIDNKGFYLSSEHQDLVNIPQLWNNVFDMSTKDELIKEIWSI